VLKLRLNDIQDRKLILREPKSGKEHETVFIPQKVVDRPLGYATKNTRVLNMTIALTGILPAVMIASAVLTAVAAGILLWLYRRAVVQSMGATSDAADIRAPSAILEAMPVADFPPLTITTLDCGSAAVASREAEQAWRQANRSLKRVALVYLVGGLSYALVFACVWMVVSAGGFIPVRFGWLFACYSWPIVLALSMVAVIDPRRHVAIVGVYGVFLIGAAVVALVRNPDLTPGQLVFFWLYANGPGTVLLLTFLRRRVRAVGPMVLAFMVTGVTGAVLAIQVVGSSAKLMRTAVAIGSSLGLSATELFVLLHLFGFVIFGILGWALLCWIGRRYRLKRASDQSLTLDAMWLLFGVVQSITMVFEGWAWIFTGFAAFAVYKLAVGVGFRVLRRQSMGDTGRPSLLLLRVFALGRRSERLFNMMSKLWLRAGSINLIAGPDLVTAMVEPHEFLDFLGHKLSRRFVQDEVDLHSRLSRMDGKPDPDGRHRVNEFFCHADTWQMSMTQLAVQSTAVLMDLRSFSPANQGCLYELQELMGNVSLARVLFVIDDTTERIFLEQTLHRLWASVDDNSPNLRLSSPEVRLFRVSFQAAEDVTVLLKLLIGGGGPRRLDSLRG